jgi:UDPglucose 6-dehydrogenase
VAKIGIIGHGYVGKAVNNGFSPKNEIFVYDKFQEPSLSLEQIVNAADFIFICVPTPMDNKYTKIDLSIVDEVFRETVKLARRIGKEPIIVIKSTVIPGTTSLLAEKYHYPKVLFNPEFLTEKNYLSDFVNADRVVIGGDSESLVQKLAELYQDSFPTVPIFTTEPTTAEMVKYMANTLLASNIIFANEIFDLCQKLKINYSEVEKMVRGDKRLEKVPIAVTRRGFGLKCYPKDTVAILGLAKELGVELSVLEAAWKKNLKIRKVRDWEDIPGAVTKTTTNLSS